MLIPLDAGRRPAQPRARRRAGDGRQRLAGRRVARPRAALARLDRRLDRGPARRGRRDRAARRRQAVRPGPVLRPHPRADGPPQVLADLRGLPRSTACTSCRTPSARTATRSPAPAGRPSTSRSTSGRPRPRRRTSSAWSPRASSSTFPTLKFVSVENGFGWIPSLMWRMDAAWSLLKSEVPHLKRRAVRVHPRARLPDHPAGRGAAPAGAVRPDCWSSSATW